MIVSSPEKASDQSRWSFLPRVITVPVSFLVSSVTSIAGKIFGWNKAVRPPESSEDEKWRQRIYGESPLSKSFSLLNGDGTQSAQLYCVLDSTKPRDQGIPPMVAQLTSRKTRMTGGVTDLDCGGKAVPKIFIEDAQRATGTRKMYFDYQDQVVKGNSDLKQLIEKIDERTGARTPEVLETFTQRPQIDLRTQVQTEFSQFFGYNPHFNDEGIFDQSLHLITHPSILVKPRYVGDIHGVLDMETNHLELGIPVHFEAEGEYNLTHNTIEYKIYFFEGNRPLNKGDRLIFKHKDAP